MKLRTKSLLALACTCLILVGVNTLTARLIVYSGFADLEKQQSRVNVRRAQKTMEEMAAGLAVTAKDYAAWDESYEFLLGGNNGYIERNLADAAFGNLKVNVMAFIRSEGSFVHVKGFDPARQIEVGVSPAILSRLVSPPLFGKLLDPRGKAGFLLQDKSLYLIASQPILRSDLSGPSPGILVMSKLLDSNERQRLSENLHIELELIPITGEEVHADLGSEDISASTNDGILVKIVDDNFVEGLVELRDIEGQPVAVLRATFPRDITRQGRVSALATTMSLLGGGVFFFIAVVVVLERAILARLGRLIRRVSAIAMNRDGSSRVPVEGRDELARLACEVNGMLDALQEQEAAFRSAFHYSNIGMAIISTEGRLVETNECLCGILGYTREELLAKDWHSLFQPDEVGQCDFPPNPKEGDTREPATERRLLHKDGLTVWIMHSQSVIRSLEGVPLYTIVQCQNITQEKLANSAREALKSQLLQAQKMEAIGTLAGGIAHDFNNVLMAIIGYTEMSLQNVQDNGILHHNLSQILRAGLRARDVVKQIVTFSRRDDQELRPISLKPIVLDAANLLRASLPAKVEIRTESSPQVGSIMGNASQIHQVLMNLCTNAAHAMEERGGIMELALDLVSVEDGGPSPHADLSPGSYVRLSVRDCGQGIDPEVMERVFEPYFTTKEQGKGTGLGLAVVHGIVKNHNGAITLQSTPGSGTSVDVYLPRLMTNPAEPPPLENGDGPAEGRILFVDDEAMLVELAESMLERLGYHVTTTMNGEDALDIFRKSPNSFDLVITDLNMPLMTGNVLAEQLQNIRKDIPIILCTGFTENRAQKGGKSGAIKEILTKPFSFGDLSEAIRRALQH